MFSMKSPGLWKNYFLQITIAVLFCILGIFVGMSVRNKELIERIIYERAKAQFSSIVLTRRWNADYGGVYVEKKEGMQSNPYLVNPDMETKDGKIYTKKNPALMTREISEYAKKDGNFQFHITSLKPLNPHNTADEFETRALQAFERGEMEQTEKSVIGDKVFFRYMAPLSMENSCLSCHEKQGYTLGDIRGGISVSFDITDIERTTRRHTYLFLTLGFFTVLLLLGVLYFFTFHLMRRLTKAMKTIEEMATIDELTQIYNRRYFFERLKEEMERTKRYNHSISCIMIDIDYFKKINDAYGHPTGDAVLRKAADLLKIHSRNTDIAARYGGEEFVKIMPETDIVGAVQNAEKIRKAFEKEKWRSLAGDSFSLTISLGASYLDAKDITDKSMDELLSQADKSLYKAKMSGRNRVEVM
ncbi:MAG: diguanylate cyclase [Candidatus Omnitrophota bacterium]